MERTERIARAGDGFGVRMLAGMALCGAVLLLAACAAPSTRPALGDRAAVAAEAERQREFALRRWLEVDSRVWRLYYPLTLAAADLCRKTRGVLGLLPLSLRDLPKDLRAAARRLYGATEALQVLDLVPAGAAARAGLRTGDRIVGVTGRSTPEAREALKVLDRALRDGGPFTVVVLRDGARRPVRIVPDRGCAYALTVSDGDEVNAYADGRRIVVTRGLIRFAESDREVQLVLAHELAHNAMGHLDKKMANYFLGSILDAIVMVYGSVDTGGAFGRTAAQSFSVEFEQEADYVGMYIMARAGVPLEGVEAFWRRMAAEHPGSIGRGMGATHPATPERFAAIRATAAEIRRKREAGRPLVPERRK